MFLFYPLRSSMGLSIDFGLSQLQMAIKSNSINIKSILLSNVVNLTKTQISGKRDRRYE